MANFLSDFSVKLFVEGAKLNQEQYSSACVLISSAAKLGVFQVCEQIFN